MKKPGDPWISGYFHALLRAILEAGQISTAMKMITAMERIGGHCTNIAQWVEFSDTGIHKDCQQVKCM